MSEPLQTNELDPHVITFPNGFREPVEVLPDGRARQYSDFTCGTAPRLRILGDQLVECQDEFFRRHFGRVVLCEITFEKRSA